MSLSRRAFLSSIGAGSAGALLAPMVPAQGAEALLALGRSELAPPDGIVRLDSNENPNGPGDRLLAAIHVRSCRRLPRLR